MRKYDNRLVTFLVDRRGEFICVPCIFAMMRQEDGAFGPETKNSVMILDTVGTCVICGELTDGLRADVSADRTAAVAVI